MGEGRRQLLGSRLKAARKQARLSQTYVAEALGIKRQSVSAWETGISGPSAAQLAELSELYCRCAHSLLFGAPFASVVVAALVPRLSAATSQ